MYGVITYPTGRISLYEGSGKTRGGRGGKKGGSVKGRGKQPGKRSRKKKMSKAERKRRARALAERRRLAQRLANPLYGFESEMKTTWGKKRLQRGSSRLPKGLRTLREKLSYAYDTYMERKFPTPDTYYSAEERRLASSTYRKLKRQYRREVNEWAKKHKRR